jgi:dihydropteroate synthase
MSVEDSYFHSIHSMKVHDKLYTFETPMVMGILNCTPDSFYKNSRFQEDKAILNAAEKQISDGASILDVGGYSTRPGAINIDLTTEIERTAHAVALIRNEYPEILISIDTFRSEVARIAMAEGASMINDISGGEIDPEIWQIAAKNNCPYILMHMRGTPQTMQENTTYSNLFKEIAGYFSLKIEQLKKLGVNDVILDPGFGFSKTTDQNFELLNRLEDFHFLRKPLLVGISRKSMIYKTLEIEAESALNGTTVLNTLALIKGAKILRVHDVKEAKQAVELIQNVECRM